MNAESTRPAHAAAPSAELAARAGATARPRRRGRRRSGLHGLHHVSAQGVDDARVQRLRGLIGRGGFAGDQLRQDHPATVREGRLHERHPERAGQHLALTDRGLDARRTLLGDGHGPGDRYQSRGHEVHAQPQRGRRVFHRLRREPVADHGLAGVARPCEGGLQRHVAQREVVVVGDGPPGDGDRGRARHYLVRPHHPGLERGTRGDHLERRARREPALHRHRALRIRG